MRKKVIVFFYILFFMLFCGCTSIYKDNINTSMGKENVMNYNCVKEIRLIDAIENEYNNNLNIILDSDDTYQLVHIASDIKNNKNINMKKTWYAIEFVNSDKEIIDIWLVDIYRTIKVSNGYKIRRSGDIDIILSKIEEKYGITKKLLERKPGTNYFYDSDSINNGVFQKKVSTNFDNDYKCKLSLNTVNFFKDNKSLIQIEDQKKEYDIEYVIILYNNDGNSIYSFHIDKENKIYTSSGYMLKGDFINKWTNMVLEEALKE